MMNGRRMRAIFSINTGRSGSDYLHRIFSHVPGCHAFHEPAPIGNGRAMRRFARGDERLMRTVAAAKADAVRASWRTADVYFESNHCFIKGFGWLLPHLLPDDSITVIYLIRDVEKIVASALRIGCSPLTPLGREWISTPDKRRPLVQPPAVLGMPRLTFLAAWWLRRWQSRLAPPRDTALRRGGPLHAYELDCLRWYVAETEAMAALFCRRFPAVRYLRVELDTLNDPVAVRRLLAALDCAPAPTLDACVGRPTNLMRGTAGDPRERPVP